MKSDEEKSRICAIRLSEAADRLVRHEGLRRGEIGQRIRFALESEDLISLPVDSQARRPGPRPREAMAFSPTSVSLPTTLYDRVREIARGRKVSMAMLIESAIVRCYSRG